MVKEFSAYINESIVKKKAQDASRAGFLLKESKQSFTNLLEIIEKIGINDNNVNTIIKHSYDILMQFIRSKMLLQGYNASGQGAHEAEIAFLRLLKCSETNIEFVDQLRYFRNGIVYYGKSFDATYAIKVVDFLKSHYLVLTT